MLCHPQRRGGGDIPANVEEMSKIDAGRGRCAKLFKGVEDVKGRWRGGRILGTSAVANGDPDWPTTNEVLSTGADISALAIKHLVAVSHF